MDENNNKIVGILTSNVCCFTCPLSMVIRLYWVDCQNIIDDGQTIVVGCIDHLSIRIFPHNVWLGISGSDLTFYLQAVSLSNFPNFIIGCDFNLWGDCKRKDICYESQSLIGK